MPASAPSVALHPEAAALQFLLGTWAGEGQGHYPTIAPFAYGEEIRVWHVGKPFLAYSQRTWALDDGRPLHSESGYWRPKPDGVVELVIAIPTGHVEIEEGTIDGTTVSLSSRLVGATSSATVVSAVARNLVVADDVLHYVVSMAAVGEPLQEHLTADLRRVP
ncbi:MAG: FABP family protein [Actinomycetota bacterium]|nr:FABP family protein [Actinomycetota bacterium]MDQ6948600.1 FABP family protein [Actinomycetota bacterium]